MKCDSIKIKTDEVFNSPYHVIMMIPYRDQVGALYPEVHITLSPASGVTNDVANKALREFLTVCRVTSIEVEVNNEL